MHGTHTPVMVAERVLYPARRTWVRYHLTDKDLVTALLPNQGLRDLSLETSVLKPEPIENVRKPFKLCETWDPR